jgi:predicted ATP-grasp superfamily ATP-dependent carboligase
MALDTYKAVKMLKEAGFDEPQAEAVVTTVGNAFDDTVATKTDVAELRIEIQEIRTEIQEVRAEIRELEQRMTIKMGGFLAATIGLITALNKLIG